MNHQIIVAVTSIKGDAAARHRHADAGLQDDLISTGAAVDDEILQTRGDQSRRIDRDLVILVAYGVVQPQIEGHRGDVEERYVLKNLASARPVDAILPRGWRID